MVFSALLLNNITPDFYRPWCNIINFIGLEGFIEAIRKSLIRITCLQLKYSENLKEREHLGAPDIDRRVMLQRILNTLDTTGWSGFTCS